MVLVSLVVDDLKLGDWPPSMRNRCHCIIALGLVEGGFKIKVRQWRRHSFRHEARFDERAGAWQGEVTFEVGEHDLSTEPWEYHGFQSWKELDDYLEKLAGAAEQKIKEPLPAHIPPMRVSNGVGEVRTARGTVLCTIWEELEAGKRHGFACAELGCKSGKLPFAGA